jgi:hypothetical protein
MLNQECPGCYVKRLATVPGTFWQYEAKKLLIDSFYFQTNIECKVCVNIENDQPFVGTYEMFIQHFEHHTLHDKTLPGVCSICITRPGGTVEYQNIEEHMKSCRYIPE